MVIKLHNHGFWDITCIVEGFPKPKNKPQYEISMVQLNIAFSNRTRYEYIKRGFHSENIRDPPNKDKDHLGHIRGMPTQLQRAR